MNELLNVILEGPSTGRILDDIAVVIDLRGDGGRWLAVECNAGAIRTHEFLGVFAAHRRLTLARYFRARLSEAIRRGEID